MNELKYSIDLTPLKVAIVEKDTRRDPKKHTAFSVLSSPDYRWYSPDRPNCSGKLDPSRNKTDTRAKQTVAPSTSVM